MAVRVNLNSATREGLITKATNGMGALKRCRWATTDLAIRYHDEEWGVPLHDDRALFEFLVLEGAQAGLSWETILKKRARYRQVFDNFEPSRVARYGARKIAALLRDPEIIRNRLKILAAVENARAFLDVQRKFASFDAYIWQFVLERPRRNGWRWPSQIPAQTPQSEAMSKDLRRRGFRFVGPTICYAYMQAVGLVNDHTMDCFRYREIT